MIKQLCSRLLRNSTIQTISTAEAIHVKAVLREYPRGDVAAQPAVAMGTIKGMQSGAAILFSVALYQRSSGL